MAKRKPFTFESNLDKIIPRIEAAPERVLGLVGFNLVKEIKATTMKQQFKRRYKILTMYKGSVGIGWAYGYNDALKKKNITYIEIGFKAPGYNNGNPGLIGKMMTGEEPDPIKPVVVKNAEVIQDMLRVAMNEIGKR